MSWFLPEPNLKPGERLLWRRPASLSLRTGVGGALHVTTERIVFVPNSLNWGWMRAVHEWPVDVVKSVSTINRDYTLYTGGMRRRMCITLKSGERLLFVVKRLDDTVREVEDVLGAYE